MSQATEQPNPFVQFLIDYRDHPVKFVQEVLGVEPDVWQAEFLNAIAAGNRKLAVRSGHGVGKSTATSWAALWYLLTRYPVKVVVTAPTSAQLFDALFAELKRWCKELPPDLAGLLDVKQERVELKSSPTEAFISARTSRQEQPEALQGIHSDNVMLIADEASGVPEAVFEAAAGSMSGHNACTLLLGNPVRSSGYFYDVFHRMAGEWWTRRVSCVDSPRVSDEYVREMQLKYGPESNAYRVRVLGEFPTSDDDTVIALEMVEAAMSRDIQADELARPVWGLDVARFGNDCSSLCKRVGAVVIEPPMVWKKVDLMHLVGAVKAEYDVLPPSLRPLEILVDSIGLGAGVVDRLRELGLPARGVNVSESPAFGTTYANLRAELWYKAKAWLEQRGCKLPKDDRLLGELVGVRYKFQSSGKIQIESKEDMKRRGMPSPDVADAFVLTFASDAAVGIYGGVAKSWSKPLKRGLAMP